MRPLKRTQGCCFLANVNSTEQRGEALPVRRPWFLSSRTGSTVEPTARQAQSDTVTFVGHMLAEAHKDTDNFFFVTVGRLVP
jgi:hypothetical protein